MKPVEKNPLRIDRLKPRNLRSFRQNPELQRQNQQRIKPEEDPGQTHQQGVAIWPHPGRRIAAKAAILRQSWGVRGSVCSPDLPGILVVRVFAYKKAFAALKMDANAEIGLSQAFSFLGLGFFFSFLCNLYVGLG